jgi:hypothetical protein
MRERDFLLGWRGGVATQPTRPPRDPVGHGNSDSRTHGAVRTIGLVVFFLVYWVVGRLFRVFVGSSSVAALEVENAVLRHELALLRRSVKRPHLRRRDRLLLVAASRLVPRDRWSVGSSTVYITLIDRPPS